MIRRSLSAKLFAAQVLVIVAGAVTLALVALSVAPRLFHGHVRDALGVTFGEAAGAAIVQFAVILPIGFVLGWAFQRHGIAASIAGHVGYNGALLLLAMAAGQVALQGA